MGRSDRTTPDEPADARTHYQVLGVGEGASRDDVRRAHRQLAHLLHPDRLAGAAPADRSLAERRMREVNAAWSVLSDPDRRAAYDRDLRSRRGATGRPAAASAGAATTSPVAVDADDPDEAWARARMAEVDPDEPELSAAHFWLLRRGPLVAVLAVAVLLFVVTAYAGSGGGRGGASTTVPARATAGGNCVQVNADRVGIRVDCAGPNDGTIVSTVQRVQDCPDDTRYVSLTPDYVCVRRETR